MFEKVFSLLKESTEGNELELLFLNDLKCNIEDDYSESSMEKILLKIKEISNLSLEELYIFLLEDIDEVFKNHYGDILDIIDYCKNSSYYNKKEVVRSLKYDAEKFVCFTYKYCLLNWIDVIEDYLEK